MSRCNRATEISLDRSPQFVRQARSIKQPSRMRNGTALLPDIDGRSAIARRFKDITSAILADQGVALISARRADCSWCVGLLPRRFLLSNWNRVSPTASKIDIQEHALL
jgi:hypothetical protein